MVNVLKSPFLRYGAFILIAVTLISLSFPGFVQHVIGTGRFMPHATCYLRDPGIIWLHVGTDLIIGLSYVSIALTLSYLVLKASSDIPFHWVFLAFGLFIISCGFTHFMEIWTVWEPRYWLAGYVKLITAVASVTTAFALFPLVPRVFRMISDVRIAAERREQIVVAHRELGEVNQELNRQKQELEQANRDLQMFAYSVAHDLRGPSRAISGLCSVIREDYRMDLKPEADELLGRVVQASENMNRLLNDLLQYTRISREAVVLEPVSLRSVLDQSLGSLQPEIARQQARITRTGDDISVLASPTLLLQVLSNLIDNALKYMPKDRTPDISIRTDEGPGGMVRIAVEDNGIGIAPEQHSKVFGLFVRLHHSHDYPGTGLGLAIVHRAAERMNGKVGLTSEPGKGSCFWIELQRPVPPA